MMDLTRILTRDVLELAELLVAAEGVAARLGLRIRLEPLEGPPAGAADGPSHG